MDYNFLFRLSICFLLSFLVGLERQYRRRIIGLRTTILVAIGAFLFVSFSFQVGSTDISRIASQVVTGISFLGTGVILKEKGKIRGLTTAATLWCMAAIGVLTAGGAIVESVVATFIILFSNIVLRYVNLLIGNLNHSKSMIYTYKLTVSTDKKVENLKKEIQIFLNSYAQIKTSSVGKNLKDYTFVFEFQILEDNNFYLKDLENILNNKNITSFELKMLGQIKPDEFDD